ncbi:MAG: mitochondrial fission ELM1 family protein [Alphaproteobacteria bacterium]|nr:mitochondrial fission ELM1 family protein [Alphaproteobacteria bacterium]
MTKKIWILADDRTGNVNQLLGIAERLNCPFEKKEIRYNSWIKLPNFLRRKTLIGLTEESKRNVQTNTYPDLVLSAGRRSYPVALWLKKMSKGKTKIVQLMNPGKTYFNEADLVILPEHDLYKGHSKNVLISTGTPHRITPERLEQEKKKWEPVFKQYQTPRLSLIVGGATKNNPFTIDMAKELLSNVKKLKPKSVLVTTSRRTPAEIVSYLKDNLDAQTTFFYQFGDKSENPYFGLLSSTDIILVTGDSMSMCSECCATNVPVFIFAPDSMMSEKHKRFHQSLFNSGYALPAGSSLKKTKGNFNPSTNIIHHIQKLF